MENNS